MGKNEPRCQGTHSDFQDGTKIYVKFVSHPTGPIIKEDISVSYSKGKRTLLYFIKRLDKFF